jgi:apolipoprotein N-acyltransferase
MVMLIFSNGIQFILSIATWIAPVFLLRFLRIQSKRKGFLLFLPLFILAWIYMVFGLYSGIPEWVSVITGVVYSLVFFPPFLADRLITPKIKGYPATLVFPLALVSLEYLLSLTPFNTWFSLAYTQSGTLALIQLVSVTGIWGVSFLIAWFASVVNWAWENEFIFPKIRKGAVLYLGILVAVLLFGIAYLTFMPADGYTVQTAGIT